MKLAQRSQLIAPSATLALDAQSKQMVREGIDVINFGVGEPDFDTPDNVKEAAIAALRDGKTKYTPASGIHELKEAVARQFQRENGLEYSTDDILITVGAKHALYNLTQVLLDPGDEVIIPAPYWVSYAEQVKVTGAVPVIVDTKEENGFIMTREELAAAVTPKTKMIVLNSPSNPTGGVYERRHLEAIADIAVSYGLIVVSDEIYQPFIYDGAAGHTSIASLNDDIKKLTFVVHGVSKSHAMTGWRIGWVAGDASVIKSMTALQGHATSNPTSIAQWAAIEAIDGPQDAVEQMVTEFAKRREYVVERLRALDGVNCNMPKGAFYAFPNIESAFGTTYKGQRIENSSDLCSLLLTEAHVSIVPGSAFGIEGFMRLSYAASTENLERGLDRVTAFWEDLER